MDSQSKSNATVQRRARRSSPPNLGHQKAGDDGFDRAFGHLCHLVSLSRTGKMRAAMDSLVITAVNLCRCNPVSTAAEVTEAIRAFFGITVAIRDAQASIDRSINDGRLIRLPGSGNLGLDAVARGDMDERVAQSTALEEAVRAEWSIELRAEGLAADEAEVNAYWSCLRSYMARAFRQHGVLAVQLLDATLSPADSERAALSVSMDQAIAQARLDGDSKRARAALSSFFKTTTPQRARYIAQLLDATFTLFALTVNDDATAEYLSGALKPLALFLDTNYIFGLLGIHENPLSDISKELVAFIQRNAFPFTLYVHERTLKEIGATMDAVSGRLLGRRWSQELSRAALATQTVTGVEQTYHRLNAETPIDPKVYLSKFDHIIDLLGDYGVKVYRVSQHEQYSVQEKGELIAEYDHYVNEHRTNPKPYEALDHDICVWLTLQTKRSQARAALDAGALFLTNDVIFHNFDWRVLRRENIGTVVLPGQLLQVLRPFVPSTDDLDLRFVEAFAAPEFRTTHNDYQETAAKVLSYLTIYKDIPEVTAIKVLTDELLLCQLQGADADSGAFGELVENALVQQNALLLEEKEAMARQLETERVAAAQQIATAAAELEANKAAIGLAEAAAEAREEKAREEERLAVQRVADEKVEASRSEAERLRTELRQKDRRHFVFHLVVAAIGLLLGWAAILLVPHLTNWQWLHTNSGRNGLYGCALIAWGAVCWTVAKPSHYKTALLPIAFAAVLVGLTLVR